MSELTQKQIDDLRTNLLQIEKELLDIKLKVHYLLNQKPFVGGQEIVGNGTITFNVGGTTCL